MGTVSNLAFRRGLIAHAATASDSGCLMSLLTQSTHSWQHTPIVICRSVFLQVFLTTVVKDYLDQVKDAKQEPTHVRHYQRTHCVTFCEPPEKLASALTEPIHVWNVEHQRRF